MGHTFLAGLVVAGRSCVVIGADGEAVSKATRLMDAGARVRLVAETLPAALHSAHERGALTWSARTLEITDLDDAFLVVDCRRDPPAAASLYERAIRPGGFLLCAIDQPAYCTFTNVAVVRRGPLQIAVASDGQAPMLAGRIRASLEAQLGDDLGEFADRLGRLRAQTEPTQRREVLTTALNEFALVVTYVVPDLAPQTSARTAETERALPSPRKRSRPVHKRRGSR